MMLLFMILWAVILPEKYIAPALLTLFWIWIRLASKKDKD